MGKRDAPKKGWSQQDLAEMCIYEAANKLVENKSLLTRNLKAFIPLYCIFRTGIIRDVLQDFSIDILRDSITSPSKFLIFIV